MEEQHTGMRKLQGAIQIMKELQRGYATEDGRNFAEYIFDQKMLKGELWGTIIQSQESQEWSL